MKALLLRVGIDKGYGALSPVFSDMSFEYIPIFIKNIKEIEKNEKRSYSSLKGFTNKFLSEYLHNKFKDKLVHLDPEFKTFTYGDPTRVKRSALLKLEKDDLLIFYIGGRKQIGKNLFEDGCFIIGFFEIMKIVDWNNTTPAEKKIYQREFKNNAHIISSKSRNNLVIVKGGSKSKLLKKCIQISKSNSPITNPPYITMPEFQSRYGLRKNIVRAVPMYIINESKVKSLKELLIENT